MKSFLKSLQVVFSKRDSLTILISSTFFLLISVLLFKKAPMILSVINLDFGWFDKITLVFSVLLDLGSTFTTGSLTLIILGSILSGINIAFAYTYFRTRAKVLIKYNVYSGTGLFFALLGVGCAACGTALLSALLGFLGLSSVLGLLPYQGLEIGYLGLAILLLATISLSKRVLTPNVC